MKSKRKGRDPGRSGSPLRATNEPQQDLATGTDALDRNPDEPAYADARLPHERDEIPERDPESPRAVVLRGYEDLREGQQDTDGYSKVAADYRRKKR